MKRYLLILILPPLLLIMAFSQQPHTTVNEGVKWYSMKEAQRLAMENGKKVFIYAMAEWCGYCKKMEREVYPDQEVIKTLDTYYYPVILNIESDKTIVFNNETMTEQQFARKFRISATPTFFFLNEKGEILGAQPGYIPADTFNSLLTYVGTDTYAEMKFEEYLEQKGNGSGGE